MNPFEQTKSPPPPLSGGDDEVIELTEVVEEAAAPGPDEAPAEVVLDFRPDRDDLDFLKPAADTRDESQAAPPVAPQEESLDDFLASLPDLPADLDISLDTTPAPAPPTPDLPHDLAQRLSDEELRELVRQVVQETVDRLARELFPGMASEAIARELNLWKKRLTESD
ncbi:MAG: hypothetical protein WAU47_06115 [Desulfobaccales bacterium]